MWLASITLSDLVMVITEVHPRPIYLVQPAQLALEFQREARTLLSKRTPTRKSSISLPGVWVPPIGLHIPASERPFGSTPSGLQELWSEITGTLLVSPEPK